MFKGMSMRLAGLLALGLGVLFVGIAEAQGPGGFGKKGKGGPGGGGGGGGAIEKLEGEVKALKEQMNRIEGMLRGKGGPAKADDKRGGPGPMGGGFPGMPGGMGRGGFEKKSFEKFKGKESKKEEPKREFGKFKGKEKGDMRGGDRGGDRGGNREVEQTIDRLIKELENLRRQLRR